RGDQEEVLKARTVLWAAGVRASKMGELLANKTGAQLDRAGRVMVQPDLSVPNHPNIFVVGDLAHCTSPDGKLLPGVAPVAMQEGQYVAKLIKARLKEQTLGAFQYKDSGNLAVIGRNAAVVNMGKLKFSGFPAWVLWLFVHIYYLIEFDNKLIVMTQWAWNYLTHQQGARLITGRDVEKVQSELARTS
ncbi:MAG TPA: FAD-dependent oxidoreductase, partial [Trichocoleus sp.]